MRSNFFTVNANCKYDVLSQSERAYSVQWSCKYYLPNSNLQTSNMSNLKLYNQNDEITLFPQIRCIRPTITQYGSALMAILLHLPGVYLQKPSNMSHINHNNEHDAYHCSFWSWTFDLYKRYMISLRYLTKLCQFATSDSLIRLQIYTSSYSCFLSNNPNSNNDWCNRTAFVKLILLLKLKWSIE